MTVKELKSIMQTAAMNKPFVTIESAYELGIDETYISISFAGNYAGQARKLRMEGDRFILDGSFDMDDPTTTPDAETLLVMLETAPEDAEVVYFVPSMGTFPVVSADRKIGDWGDGDGTFDMIDIKCTEEPVDELDKVSREDVFESKSVKRRKAIQEGRSLHESVGMYDKAQLGADLNAAPVEITPAAFFKMLKRAGMNETDLENLQTYLADEEEIWEEEYTTVKLSPSCFLECLGDWEDYLEDEEEENVSNFDLIKDHWPDLSDDSIYTIADWYHEEGGKFDPSDFMDMLWASNYNDDEVVALQQDLVDCGYKEAEDMPGLSEEEDE